MTTRKGPQDLGNSVPFKKPKLQAAPPPIWCDDSDDDDLILLASQAVEQNNGGGGGSGSSSGIAGTSTTHTTTSTTPDTFQSFVSDFKAKTSTQQHQQVSAPKSPLSVNVALRAKVTSNLVLVNQDKASQDFLRKRIESLERDHQRSKDECKEAQEKFQIKDYEISSLKYEMKELQRANSELRLKMVKNEQFNKEMQRNKAMEKQLQKAETELELKRLELLKLKSGRRMSASQAGVVPMDVTVTVEKKKEDDPPIEPRNPFQLDVLHVSRFAVAKEDSWQFRLSHRIFENVPEMELGTGQVFVEQLTHLQRAMGGILLGQPPNVEEVVSHTVEGMKLALSSIWAKYDASMQWTTKHRGGGGNRRNILSAYDLERDGGGVCIYDKQSMFDDEELISFRRILAIFALATKCSAALREAFFRDAQLCDTLLQVLRGLFRATDDYQRRTMGVIQASAVLLLNLVEGGGHESEKDKIPLLFKAITFSRLDSFTIYTLLKVLQKLDVEVTRTFLCTGCGSKEYVINGTYNTAHFTTDSCPLQVLTTSIECVFPFAVDNAEEYWTLERYRKLLGLAKCLMQFFRKGVGEINADWLKGDRSCLCYIKLTTSFVILAHLSLHLFHTLPKLRTEMRQIQTVSQLTLLLIHDIFTANLQMRLLHSMGRPIKNRLIVVYNLLMHYNAVFQFRLAQVKALESFEVNLLSNAFVRPPVKAVVLATKGSKGADGGESDSEQQREEKGQLIWDSISV